MPRQVLVGPATVDVATLGDADFSFFDRIRLQGTATKGQNLRYLSLVDCRVTADLRPADIRGIEATRTDCTGYRVTPKQIDRCVSSDLVLGYISTIGRDYVTNTLGLSNQVAKKLFDYDQFHQIPEGDRTSWKKLMQRWKTISGRPIDQVRTAVRAIYSTLPRIQNLQSTDGPKSLDLSSVPVHYGQPLDLRGEILLTRDRWAGSQHLDRLHPGIKFWVNTVPFGIIAVDTNMASPLSEFWMDGWSGNG